jgi:hypothetical protein
VRTLHAIATASILAAAFSAPGQTTNADFSANSTNAPAAAVSEASEKKWSFSASVYTYIVPDSRDYPQPTVTADHEHLHLEARYNYESLETGSLWIGANLSGGEKLTWELTPMLGGVFGDLTGIAPGYKGLLGWWKLELYSEGEYVVDPGNSSNNFFYNWSELTIAPLDWFRIGMVTQRTRAYQTDRDIQRGLFLGFTYKHLDLTTALFNIDESRPTTQPLFCTAGAHGHNRAHCVHCRRHFDCSHRPAPARSSDRSATSPSHSRNRPGPAPVH